MSSIAYPLAAGKKRRLQDFLDRRPRLFPEYDDLPVTAVRRQRRLRTLLGAQERRLATIIEVGPAPEDDITLSELALRHLGCAGTMSALRKLGTDLYTVRCSCGLWFDAPKEGAAREIVNVANTGEPTTLSRGSYFAADDGAVEIVPPHWDP